MAQPSWFRPLFRQKARTQPRPGLLRDWLAKMLALVTVAGLVCVFLFSRGTAFLMPGPLTSAHGAVKECSSCHTKSGSGKLSWVHGLIAGDPRADSKACLSCHKMPDTAFNAHSASDEVLKESTERLRKVAASTPAPHSARVQSVAFPAHKVSAEGLTCATCHQEHQGTNFDLNKMTNAQCRSCHVVKFDSFERDHPKFENYPFKRRTRLVYDHAAHFNKHYPEVAKKDPSKRIPDTCSACHNSRDDKRVMSLAPFDQTCATCHLGQIKGLERASGPKGIAFLSLPGLDLQSLKSKNAPIGEWPEDSEAQLSPLMKVMIGRSEKGRALVKIADSLNLQDLTQASEAEVKAVADLTWEIKTLFHALISGKAQDALGGVRIGGAKLSANQVSDLTSNIPRDVVVAAQQQWLPNLAAEIANGPGARVPPQDSPAAASPEPGGTEAAAPEDESGSDAQQETSESSAEVAEGEAAVEVKRDPPACALRLFGQCLVSNETDESGNKPTRSAEDFPGRMNAGLGDIAPAPAAPRPQKKGAAQTDDLLFPTEDELREINAHNKNSGKAVAPRAAPAGTMNTGPANSQTDAAGSALDIESGVDAESWAENGGWYREDYAIFYRPAGHKDKFITSWLTLTGPVARKGDTSPSAAVFEFLTHKDAQGSCTKCHSVDDIQGRGRSVNFAPLSLASKQGSFTRFIHQPHFGVIGDRGCLTCHETVKGRPYLKSYEQGNPHAFASEFSMVKKNLCQTCHTSGMARQDCMTCHKYHVNDAIAPITKTKNTAQ